mmetsp:Transcript_14281/g.36459  ORF Transcript_14281/g.36459 Transcript_14281/m.36459 type:complete len:230 (+) Transcript_14281:459-1148(+)
MQPPHPPSDLRQRFEETKHERGNPDVSRDSEHGEHRLAERASGKVNDVLHREIHPKHGPDEEEKPVDRREEADNIVEDRTRQNRQDESESNQQDEARQTPRLNHERAVRALSLDHVPFFLNGRNRAHPNHGTVAESKVDDRGEVKEQRPLGVTQVPEHSAHEQKDSNGEHEPPQKQHGICQPHDEAPAEQNPDLVEKRAVVRPAVLDGSDVIGLGSFRSVRHKGLVHLE